MLIGAVGSFENLADTLVADAIDDPSTLGLFGKLVQRPGGEVEP